MRLKLVIVLLILVNIFASELTYSQMTNNSLEISRENSVRVIASDLRSQGTGFFLDSMHVATCFHVVAQIDYISNSNQKIIQSKIANNITITLTDGEVIPVACISVPSEKEPSPLLNDFAILQLSHKPKVQRSGIPFYNDKKLPKIGSDIVFSGYPLGAPTMLTHKGYISGVTNDQAIICLQAPINKGNSGGAALTERGEVIGIISNREGSISKSLAKVFKQITDLEQGKSGVQINIKMAGTNILPVTKEIVSTVDKYISTGIGYARSIKKLQDYLSRNPIQERTK